MGYQKIENLSDSASNQPSRFRTRNWVEINDESRGTYTSNDIKFKTTMLRSNLCDYADAYILVKGTITITGAGNDDAAKRLDERNKGVIFKNCAPFTKCISRINNKDIDNAQDIDIVMPMYNLIEYSDNYSKTSGSLWQYCKDIPAVNNNGNIFDFTGANATTNSFIFKSKITGETDNNGRINTETMVALKYLSNFWRNLEITFLNCEVNLILTWSKNCVISSTNIEELVKKLYYK